MSRLQNLATITSQFVNAVILGGSPDETVSGRAYRQGFIKGDPVWERVHSFINTVFLDPDHCRLSHLRDVEFAKAILNIYR